MEAEVAEKKPKRMDAAERENSLTGLDRKSSRTFGAARNFCTEDSRIEESCGTGFCEESVKAFKRVSNGSSSRQGLRGGGARETKGVRLRRFA